MAEALQWPRVTLGLKNVDYSQAGFWIHPSKPENSISHAVQSCNAVLWHYHCSHGRQLSRNWDTNPLSTEDATERAKSLQSYINQLSELVLGKESEPLTGIGNLEVMYGNAPKQLTS